MDLAGDPSLVRLVPSPEGKETCPNTRTTREEEATQDYSHERMRRASEGRLKRDGRSVSSKWWLGSGQGEKEWWLAQVAPAPRIHLHVKRRVQSRRVLEGSVVRKLGV